MQIHRIMPIIQSEDITATRDHYVELLGFEVVMDMDWIVTLVAPGDPKRQISVMSQDATAPMCPDISIEVDDVDAAHATAVEQGRVIVHPLTDEPWGVRRFFCLDPSGTVLNILAHAA
ncbi:VOC family protein [Saccharopolyspora griseoalba]|uniref:VOC family protein n=1 Tax=Saccharopolyspora griseoalba TaxID=1431848 RepID=A0ABW2LHM7_9PSEU